MPQGFFEAIFHLIGNYGRGHKLGMGMLETGPAVQAMILEDGDVGDAGIVAEGVIARLVGTDQVGQVRLGHDGHNLRVVRSVDNDVMHAETFHGAVGTADDARRLGIARQGAELVGDDPHLPTGGTVTRKTLNFRWGLGLVARTKHTRLNKWRYDLGWAVGGELFGAFGALFRDDDPLFGEKVLA